MHRPLTALSLGLLTTLQGLALRLPAAIAVANSPPASSTEAPQTRPIIRVGVMAIRGVEQTHKQWQPTIDYLSRQISGYQFELVPLEFDTLEDLIANQQIDFVLPNPGMYVELETLYGARRIATLKNLRLGKSYTEFGAVIFRRADRTDIQTLQDLKGKSFMAVSEIAFGGWQMAWATLKEAHIDPYQQFQEIQFGGSHDAVVYAVRSGEVDAGTVRTDTLERMAQEGKINRADFVVLNNQQAQYGDSFPFAVSTRLYPEWPFATLPHTSVDLAEEVAIALMTLPSDHPAAQAGRYEGWTIPANYQPCHETLRLLNVRPYEDWGKVSIAAAAYQHRYWLLFSGLLIGGLSYGGLQLAARRRIESRLRAANSSLERRVEARTAELREAKEAAEAASRAKSEFLASMSHELRTPLNAILGFTQVMLRNLNRKHTTSQHEQLQAQRETLGIIHRSGEHLLSLINDVLDMSKIEAGRITLNEAVFDLLAMLEALIEMLQIRADAKGLTLFYECGDQVPQCIMGDERKLRQVLINLLGNALKFTNEGSVTLRVRQLAAPTHLETAPYHLIHFAVEDTGPGIAATELDHLFTAFSQTESGRNAQEGTGLGLPISHQFVQLMGGEIQVSSTLGAGTVFEFTIQVRPGQMESNQASPGCRQVVGLAPHQPVYRLLIVDDRWENRQLLVQILEPLGFELYEAENGEAAIVLWQQHQPHLIWMDIRMPVLSGYEATKWIKAQPEGKDTVIIAVTASVFEEERASILAAGCDDFVRKPFSETQIFDRLSQHLGVAYTYAEATCPNPTPPSAAKPLAPGDLAKQPAEWIAQLNLAARGAEDELIWQLLDQIPPADAPLADALAELVNNFRLDRIVHLTETPLQPTHVRQIVGLAADQPTYRLLVVDDRAENRQLLCQLLQPIGFEVDEAPDAHQAIALWQQYQPQLILLEMRLPGVSGYEVAQSIKSQPQGRQTVIIALTASVFETEKSSLLAAGCDDWLRQPLSEQQLLSKLAEHLGVKYLYTETTATAISHLA
ncbi:response regulator [Almyronema epifaneia]|uniref:histidine kinase n=1 Tax=Almyronema epifaneia S1 TaxID=2991925 RepID=A0ABW6IHE7_9CYAN